MEPSLIQSLLNWIGQHQAWAGVIIFLFAMGESLVVLGVVVPGVGVMLGVGALINLGVLPFWPCFWWAVAGAIAGDGFSFWLGYHFKDKLKTLWPLRRYPTLIDKGESFFQKHGGKSVFLGRFFGPVRAIIPTTAGMMQMPPLQFNLINIASALLWAPIYLGVGMLIGASLNVASEVATRLAMFVLMIGSLLWLSIWLVRKLYRYLAPKSTQITEQLIQWGRHHPHWGKLTAALFDPRHPELKGLIIIAALLLGLAWSVIVLFSQFQPGTPLLRFDSSIYHFLQNMRSPWADQFMTVISQLGDARIHIVLVLSLALWLCWQKRWLAVSHWLAAVGFAGFAAWFLKQTLQLPRPMPLLDSTMAYGFPSAHTLLAVCSFGFLAVFITREIHSKWRTLVYAIAASIVILIAFSRLYLGVHWLSDIMGALIIGLLWTTVLGIAFRRHISPAIPLRGLIVIPLLVLSTVGSWHVVSTYELNQQRYTPQQQIQTQTLSHWQQTGWQELASHRVDIFGQQKQVFNVQWAGSLQQLEAQLNTQGWLVIDKLNMKTALRWLSPNTPIEQLPFLPQVHDGHYPSWQISSPSHAFILRLWPSQTVISENKQPVWIGYIAPQQLANPLPLLALPTIGHDVDSALSSLQDTIATLNANQGTHIGVISSNQSLRLWAQQ